MPDALMGMYTGTSGGKRYVKVVPGARGRLLIA